MSQKRQEICDKFAFYGGFVAGFCSAKSAHYLPRKNVRHAGLFVSVVHNFVSICFQFLHPLFKCARYPKGKKGGGSREPPPFSLHKSSFSTSLLSISFAESPLLKGSGFFLSHKAVVQLLRNLRLIASKDSSLMACSILQASAAAVSGLTPKDSRSRESSVCRS